MSLAIERASPWALENIERNTYISVEYEVLVQVFAPSTGNLNDITLDRVYMNIAVVGNIEQFDVEAPGRRGFEGVQL